MTTWIRTRKPSPRSNQYIVCIQNYCGQIFGGCDGQVIYDDLCNLILLGRDGVRYATSNLNRFHVSRTQLSY